jgi:membrane protease YdiL (CAAX protease family)
VLCLAGVRIRSYLGFRKLTWKHALVAVGVATANQPVVSFLTWASRFVLPQGLLEEFDLQQRLLSTLFMGRAAVPMVVTVIVAAPLGEEIFFRGYLLPSLNKSFGVVAAVIVSGALFSVIHLEWVGFLGLMEIGMMLALLRIWSGSLWAAILGHAVNNAIAGVAFLLGFQDPDAPTPPGVLVLGAVLLAVGIWLFLRVVRKPFPVVEEPAPRRWPATVALLTVWSIALTIGYSMLRHGRTP